jgi:hypothetical protein
MRERKRKREREGKKNSYLLVSVSDNPSGRSQTTFSFVRLGQSFCAVVWIIQFVGSDIGLPWTHYISKGASGRLYFTRFPVPALPGIPAFLHFPFPGENGRESQNILTFQMNLRVLPSSLKKIGPFRVWLIFDCLWSKPYFPGSREFPGNYNLFPVSPGNKIPSGFQWCTIDQKLFHKPQVTFNFLS